ncbi:type IV toxin-antitoxin system AbiEi family antitoxin domain-containing protein [Streptosporangium sp. H16]|uniref:type IV toxin-antitoxin system AbiEi family antitoxin domain-containing protein n=1 Tax=Streptosporangium sp. H16 TaxID=3444184 RepID=UPI003F798A18
MKQSVTIPPELYERGTGVIRPRDLADRYSQPAKEARRLVGLGALRPLSHGYYIVAPPSRITDERWRPSIEAVGMAVAAVDYGAEETALAGISAARVLGAIPRALGTCVVAVPRQRPSLSTAFGHIEFVRRRVATLDVQRAQTELVDGYVTTVEQTLVDLADRPGLGGTTPRQISEAILSLIMRADWDAVLDLAREQRKHSAYIRARWLASQVMDPIPAEWRYARPVLSAGLTGPIGNANRLGVALDDH